MRLFAQPTRSGFHARRWLRRLLAGAAAGKPWRVLAITMAAVFAIAGGASTAGAATWNLGDVFAGVNSGNYKVYDNAGSFKETISQGQNGFTTGCAFSSNLDLYTTGFSASNIVKFSGSDPHPVTQTISTSASGGPVPESIVFDAAGNFYTSSVNGGGILKFGAAGNFVQQYANGVRTDWMDLSSDQHTMFYTQETTAIHRFDVGSGLPLSDFATVAGQGYAALRLLPPGDGSGGLLAAGEGNTISRFNAAGNVVQTYSVPGDGGWFALNLDPNGTSFWSGSFSSGKFYRFNIATGAVEVGPIDTGVGGGSFFGLCVRGEPTAAVPPPPPPPPPPSPPSAVGPAALAPPPKPVVPSKASISVLGVRTACVSTSFSPTISIRAPAGVKNITVSVDGRRVRTSKKSKFTLAISVRKLKAGRHSLSVVAVDSRNRTTTQQRSFFRCAQKAAAKPRPVFTG